MNKDILDRAFAIMTNRRMKAVSENERRIEEINQKIPQIKEINDKIYNTGKELISIISKNRGKDISASIQQLEEFNLGAQQISKNILVENGYPANYLEMQYECNTCHDTGYFGDRFCSCFNRLCGKLAADELNANAQIKLSTFDTFSLYYYSGEDYTTMSNILDFTKKYARNFTPHSKSILMCGKTGLGKTHLSLAIANSVLEKGYNVVYDSAINILRKIEKEHFSREHSTEVTDLILNSELLILDDLGTEFETPFYNSTIYNIVNTRYNKGVPTIISTNLNNDEIKRKYDERVASRILTLYTCLRFCGEDIRVKIRSEEIEKNKKSL